MKETVQSMSTTKEDISGRSNHTRRTI